MVSWSPSDALFADDTIYTATITLTAKSGYTLTGSTANYFTVAGAVTVTNDADSAVITAVFPDTGTVPVTFQSAVQTGGETDISDSTGLTLTFDIDPTTLAASDITVTGATKGALSGSGETRTLVISDITVSDSETVSIAITNPSDYTIISSPKTAVVYRELTIGMTYQGGKIAYILQSDDTGYVSEETHGLIASTADLDTDIGWVPNTDYTEVGTSRDFGTGQANTTKIVEAYGDSGSYAAKSCNDYTNIDTGTGEYSDWYLPAELELSKLFSNRAAIGGFSTDSYWASSERYDDGTKAYIYYFSSGALDTIDKEGNVSNVRAIRSF